MTTTVPLIYSFPEFLGVAEAVADHVISAQNMTLYNTLDHAQIELIKQDKLSRPSLLNSSSALSLSGNGNGNGVNGKVKKEKKKKVDIRFKIAISGGSLIKILKEGLLSRQDEIEWDKWDVYFADERLVPFESDDSNYGQAKRELFDNISGDIKPNIYHIDEALIDDPQECADVYEKLLIRNFAKKDSVKLPMFDLLLLGCAPDGHIASLFPKYGEQLREKLAWCLPVLNAPSGPENRITLSIPVICHAHRVTFVVEGLTKAPIMRTIMERPEKGLPSSIVNEGAAGRVTWFVDDDALNDCYDITKKKYKFLSINDPNS
ncbi:DEHA2C12738p [Debaryomyces hansenii CBS767]|jgi:6-phosphogluconolactonase|uniref:6-phosphogluconolactonase-like protein n=1 Tax=Debaryomyces hansenii (strain ATCC 36239 / CBS 767 / BCRC 21394 / JCM 1990 / NBRC 0083 / IGC 2968) TaxID=284592 RepID=Q6BU90_DEBHA|nr:DEHA2C12738p [Debaryomyces hansenii CBS767]CAG86305.1 DEHA2C12738p [Debaryomyces hansenii CBS767]|eukprot:XP_458229.1 DEHA2C12738p [Debaryomyces hansenii CBS767]